MNILALEEPMTEIHSKTQQIITITTYLLKKVLYQQRRKPDCIPPELLSQIFGSRRSRFLEFHFI